MKNLAKNLRNARKKAGLSQRGLAERAKLSQGMVYQLEKGNRSPGLKTLEKLSKALGVSVDSLRGKATETKASQELLDDKLVYEIAKTTKAMTIREKEEVLSFVKYLRRKK